MSSAVAPTLSIVETEPCKTPVDHLNNKQFSYLLEDITTDDAPNSPNNLVALSPFMRKGKKKRHNNNCKVRTSSIQVNTTETELEQLAAIKKEVEYLDKTVPHFKEIYDGFRIQWNTIASKRSVTDAAGLILIQSLTEWITSYGTKAVNEYAEFRESAEKEILSMVHKVEALNHEIRTTNLLYQEMESEKEEAVNESAAAHRELARYRNKEAELNEEKQSVSVTADAIGDLEKELNEMKKKHETLTDKHNRIEKYWKMTQDENDELRNRNYAIEEENTQFKIELRQNRESINVMNKKHEKALKSLQIEHENYAQQMHNEQEKLIAAQQNIDVSARATMTPTGDGLNAYIDADDADIAASGVTDDIEEEEEAAYVTGGIISLENEINLYQYEDDEWLDESSLSDTPAPQSAVIENVAEEEEYNKQTEFVMEKTSDYQDIEDITAAFVGSHMSFNEEQENKENAFESEKIQMEVKSKSLNLQMSSTKISHSPITARASPRMEFESVQSGVSGRRNHLIDKKAIPKAEAPKIQTITKRIVIERGAKKEEHVLKVGKNFSERLAMFQHLDETRGGKPQILESSKAFSLVSKWKDRNINSKSPLNALKITQSTKNVHVTKSTMHEMDAARKRTGTVVNVVKVTKTKAHTLKPRLFGYMNIIRTTFIQQWKIKQNPRHFFVLDGLPSRTNMDRREADGDKNRQHDFLVPTLFFFTDKAEYDEFHGKVAKLPTRSIEFQKLFARYAKGTFALDKYAMEVNISSCMKRVNQLNKKQQNIKLPISEIKACGNVDDVTILLCSEKEVHRFACNDASSRDKWVKKVNKLVDKRSRRLTLINDGLISSMDEYSTISTPKIGDDALQTPPMIIGDDSFNFTQIKSSPYDNVDPSKMIGRNTTASMVKLAKIGDENGLH